ncbi:DUF4180 domain-containing protein [bacterium]|nr:DUF4180 domain-containing protein [bacterium]
MRYLSLIILIVPVMVFAQWSAPIQVTNSQGDDCNVTCWYYTYWYGDYFRLAWDGTESNNADIYTCDFDLSTGMAGEVVQITDQPGQDVHPDFVYDTNPVGIVYQSNSDSLYSIWFAGETSGSYMEPEH